MADDEIKAEAPVEKTEQADQPATAVGGKTSEAKAEDKADTKPEKAGAKPDKVDAKPDKVDAKPEKADAKAEKAEAKSEKAANKDSQPYVARLRADYDDRIVKAMTERFGYKNRMEVPRLDKVVINMGVGDATQDK